MVSGGLVGADNGLSAGLGTPLSPSNSDDAFPIGAATVRQPLSNGKTSGGKSKQKSADDGGDQSASVQVQGQKARDFDAVQGRPPLGDGQTGETSSQDVGLDRGGFLRSAADMGARVAAYLDDFGQTVKGMIGKVGGELKTVTQKLLGASALEVPDLEKQKSDLTERHQLLQKLADGPGEERGVMFANYQNQFDQIVNDKLKGVDAKIADIDKQLGSLAADTPADDPARTALLTQKNALLEERQELQNIADTPEAALEALKAQEAQKAGEGTASDIGTTAFNNLTDEEKQNLPYPEELSVQGNIRIMKLMLAVEKLLEMRLRT